MKISTIAGCILLAGVIAAFVISSARKEKAIEVETSSFVEDTINAISKDWNSDALVRRAEPGLVKAMASQGQSIDELFNVYRKLGNLQNDPDCHLKDTSQFNGTTDSYTTASYNCTADYDHGSATLLITVRRSQGSDEWKVYYVNITSPTFTGADSR